ncbi:MAG: acyl carrier protein [Deltaproteobacteria bacterium]|nr:acyl carrier protein [Deltaproteobacteria bacterium]
MESSAKLPTPEEVKQKVKEILIEESQLRGMGLDDISEDAHLIDDLGLDSTDLVSVIFGIEEAFDISISDEEAAKCITLRAVGEAVMERLAAGAQVEG